MPPTRKTNKPVETPVEAPPAKVESMTGAMPTHEPSPALAVPKPVPVPVPVSSPVLPTAEALAQDIGRQLLKQASARRNNGARVYDAQGAVILTHGVDFVRMCFETSDPDYKALVKGATRVEVFAR